MLILFGCGSAALGRYRKRHTVRMQAGMVYTLTMKSQVATYLEVADKNGVGVVRELDSGGADTRRVVLAPLRSGLYDVHLSSGKTGRYSAPFKTGGE